ncbi:MAG TPA: glycosyltransferase family 2 protein, partial [Chitinophagaceae bacterium]|nr:glycosyltransferase family 2 protein [Chitinophagaceae bacterium]
MMAANLSILIITYNRPKDTLELLHSLKKQTDFDAYLGEVLLLNNASSVSYAEVARFVEKNKDLRIRYFDHHENLGVAGGRNFLIKRAQYPILFVLDDDVLLPDKASLKKAASLFSKDQYVKENTVIITCEIFYYSNGERQQNAFPHKRYKKYKEKDWFLTYYFTGAAHLMKKSLFERIGDYPEDFFYGMEEYDLSYRVINAGYSLAYDQSIRVLHKESPDGRVTNKEKLGMMWYNKAVVAWRYLPKKYFYSTIGMWALQYLKETSGD